MLAPTNSSRAIVSPPYSHERATQRTCKTRNPVRIRLGGPLHAAVLRDCAERSRLVRRRRSFRTPEEQRTRRMLHRRSPAETPRLSDRALMRKRSYDALVGVTGAVILSEFNAGCRRLGHRTDRGGPARVAIARPSRANRAGDQLWQEWRLSLCARMGVGVFERVAELCRLPFLSPAPSVTDRRAPT